MSDDEIQFRVSGFEFRVRTAVGRTRVRGQRSVSPAVAVRPRRQTAEGRQERTYGTASHHSKGSRVDSHWKLKTVNSKAMSPASRIKTGMVSQDSENLAFGLS